MAEFLASVGVVPAVRSFLNEFVGHFVELDAEIGLKTFEHRAKRRGHNATTD